VLQKFSWPYQLLMLVFILGLYAFMQQPAAMLASLKTSVDDNNTSQWQSLTAKAELQPYGKALMQGLLKMKYHFDWQAGHRGDAMTSYYAGEEQLDTLSQQLASPVGFPYLLCGELIGFVEQAQQSTEGCWQLQGEIEWLSPMRVKIAFNNPENNWQSALFLQRHGLFNWELTALELPIERILQHYHLQLDVG
jgi:hypothetical protein